MLGYNALWHFVNSSLCSRTNSDFLTQESFASQLHRITGVDNNKAHCVHWGNNKKRICKWFGVGF